MSLVDRWCRNRSPGRVTDERGGSPVPAFTDGGLRVCLFFSFLGRIVSELGFVRKLPFVPAAPPGGANATWGIETTVSVSTVMLCRPASPFPFALSFVDVLDCLDRRGGGATLPDRRPAAPLVSLAASVIVKFGFSTRLLEAVISSTSCCEDVSEIMLSSSPSSPSGLPLGDENGLTSSTVSKVDAARPTVRGVLVPAGITTSSGSVSGCDGDSDPDGWGVCPGGTLTGGGGMSGLLRLGGGDLSLGETGHLVGVGDLSGTGALMVMSGTTGGRDGTLDDESVFLATGGAGAVFVFGIRVGLGSCWRRSCWLFLRDQVPLFDGRELFCLVLDGEVSREASGEGPIEDTVDVWDAFLDSCEKSVVGATVAVDSRDRVGCGRLASVEPRASFDDLSMAGMSLCARASIICSGPDRAVR